MKKLLLIFILTVPLFGQTQARLILNNDAFLVISDSAVLVLDNPDTTAIMTIGTGGNIISEGEENAVKWNIIDSTGLYVVPFTTSTTKTKIPDSLTITTKGSNDGSIIFSTYETATDMNTTWPSDVTNMNSEALGGADGSLFVIDRFWRVDARSYTTKPDISLNLSYDSTANEMQGSNTITEANLAAQNFNTVTSNWNGVQGSANILIQTVSPIVVTGANLFQTWTLTDNSTPLPLELITFNAQKDNDIVATNWEMANETNVSFYEVEKSNNGKDFTNLGKVKKGDNYLLYDYEPQNGTNYYRLKITSNDSKVFYSSIKEVYFNQFPTATIYPNPTNSFSTIKIDGEYSNLLVSIINAKGQLINKSIYNNQPNINLEIINTLSDGLYHVNLLLDGNQQSFKLIKNK